MSGCCLCPIQHQLSELCPAETPFPAQLPLVLSLLVIAPAHLLLLPCHPVWDTRTGQKTEEVVLQSQALAHCCQNLGPAPRSKPVHLTDSVQGDWFYGDDSPGGGDSPSRDDSTSICISRKITCNRLSQGSWKRQDEGNGQKSGEGSSFFCFAPKNIQTRVTD